jgi:hypothetical protein
MTGLKNLEKIVWIVTTMGISAANAQNNPPIADADGPYTVVYGNDWTLDGSGSYDPDPGDFITIWTWDINEDAIWGDALGEMPTLQQADYDALLNPITLDQAYTIALRVQDNNGGQSMAQTTVTFIPEPASITLFALASLAFVRRRTP